MASEYPRRIRELRVSRGLSQRRLADLLGVSTLTVLRWEHGQTRPTALAWRQLLLIEAQAPSSLTLVPDAAAAHSRPSTVAIKRPGRPAPTAYQYDALCNPLAVRLPNGTAITYLLDGQNRRIGK